MTSDNILTSMTTVEDFLRNGDDPAAAKAATNLQTEMGCLTEVMPAMIYPRIYRAIAGGQYVGGNVQGSQDWVWAALSVEPTFDYGVEDLPPSHPFRLIYDEEKRGGVDDPVPVDKTLAEGEWYLDGRKITAPAAVPHAWHLLQSKGGDGSVKTWAFQDEWPEDAFGKAVVAEVDPKGDKGDKEPKGPKGGTTFDPSQTTTIGRDRPVEKTPLIIGGAVVLAGAGAVYYMGMQSHEQFEDASNVDEVDAAAKKTNFLFFTSLGVLAVGVGTTTWGVVVSDDGAMPTVSGRF